MLFILPIANHNICNRKASFLIQSTPPRTPVARHRLALVAAAWKPSVAKLSLKNKCVSAKLKIISSILRPSVTAIGGS
ncbi:hypothetical protein EYF80_007076 [Liparis tanakae]|uniref:Uncharacterized protein n=1 Tax=Liparis tanakae TaxID=230148 RepID=A0A4Z2IYI4_9TELE|nr:hypothetical protein EYF80_007076 [Liparis tanakae]